MCTLNTVLILLGISAIGFFSMGFQLVGSRLLAPRFGSSLIVWAFLISTFLAAFSAGSLFGGWVSRLPNNRERRSVWVIVGLQITSLGFTAWYGKEFLRLVETGIESIPLGLLIACPALFFIPVMMLSAFLPLATEMLARSGIAAGLASGLSYGLSTAGNIAGVMGTAFLLVPNFRISHLLIAWFVLIMPLVIFLANRVTRELP
jgi:hypothetical protein